MRRCALPTYIVSERVRNAPIFTWADRWLARSLVAYVRCAPHQINAASAATLIIAHQPTTMLLVYAYYVAHSVFIAIAQLTYVLDESKFACSNWDDVIS